MFDRIQSQPALQARRRIAQRISHETMGNLMDDDREYEDDDGEYS